MIFWPISIHYYLGHPKQEKGSSYLFSILEQKGQNKKVTIEDVLVLVFGNKGKLKVSPNKSVVEKLVGIFLVKS